MDLQYTYLAPRGGGVVDVWDSPWIKDTQAPKVGDIFQLTLSDGGCGAPVIVTHVDVYRGLWVAQGANNPQNNTRTTAMVFIQPIATHREDITNAFMFHGYSWFEQMLTEAGWDRDQDRVRYAYE